MTLVACTIQKIQNGYLLSVQSEVSAASIFFNNLATVIKYLANVDEAEQHSRAKAA